MGKRWVLFGLLVLLVLLIANAAFGDTGGSMGGGSWGGGGGGGGGYSGGGGGYSGGGGGYSGGGGGYSGGGGGYSGGGYTSSSSDWSSGGGAGCNESGSSKPAPGPVIGLLILSGVVVVLVFMFFANGRHSYPDYSKFNFAPQPIVAGVDISVLRVAIDGRARKFVQSELARIAKTADTATDDGRARMLREVALMLRRLRDAWVYGGAVNHPMRDLGGAKREFDKAVDDARARFREEVIRNADGSIATRTASEYSPRSDEGAGLILVSMIVAARRELYTVQRIGNGDDLRQALDAASQLTPSNLVAIEIVWQPAEETDRLSSMELEAKYPRPELIPIAGALVGKTFCNYCSGPFPAELVSCPHCGAPAPGRDNARAS